MATVTLGSIATTTLTALQFPSFAATTFADADIATIVALIKNDVQPTQQQVGAWSRMGILYVPNRGFLTCRQGDFVAVGADGWPILVSAIACATTVTRTGTPINTTTSMVMTASVLAAGWQIGGQITGSGIAAGTLINNISADGLTVTLSKAATSSPGATTITYGTYVHS